jgi:hypothetical protein
LLLFSREAKPYFEFVRNLTMRGMQEAADRKAIGNGEENIMLIIIAATIMALTLTALFLVKGQKTDPAQLNEPRTSIPTMGVQIICGDCSGEGLIPFKTFLNHSGNCDHCGGHSYLLASSLALHAMQMRAERVAQYQSESSNGRVIPFEVPARVSRSEKIAV